MARKYRTYVREEKAVEYTVTVEGLEKYQDAWLIICNSAREYRRSFYKVSNRYDSNNIYVLCPAENEIDMESWLSQFGEVKVDKDKVAVIVDVECEYQDFDKDYIDSEIILGDVD